MQEKQKRNIELYFKRKKSSFRENTFKEGE